MVLTLAERTPHCSSERRQTPKGTTRTEPNIMKMLVARTLWVRSEGLDRVEGIWAIGCPLCLPAKALPSPERVVPIQVATGGTL